MRTATALNSSNIDMIGYEPETLFIRFNHGGVYRYDKVPVEIFDGICQAESSGKFFHAEIKGRFDFVKLDSDPFILPS